MMPMVARAVLALVFPFIVFAGGGRLMLVAAGANADRAVTRLGKPLNQRWAGYTRDEVLGLWGAIDDHDLRVERRLLQIDLLFPFLYGTALILALLALRTMLGGRVNPALLLGPVIVGLLADWTENLVQLQQLNGYAPGAAREPAAIGAGAIAIASAATSLKLVSLAAGAGLVLLLFVLVLLRSRSAA
jgi:hypothetical protein